MTLKPFAHSASPPDTGLPTGSQPIVDTDVTPPPSGGSLRHGKRWSLLACRRYFTAKLSPRLILMILGATVPAMLVGIFVLSQAATHYLRTAADDKLGATASHLAERVDSWSADSGHDMRLLAGQPDVVNMNPATQRLALR
ncbi:MAG: hypothetical protein WCI73_16195, partial [Phycisphaerae bacterium]